MLLHSEEWAAVGNDKPLSYCLSPTMSLANGKTQSSGNAFLFSWNRVFILDCKTEIMSLRYLQ